MSFHRFSKSIKVPFICQSSKNIYHLIKDPIGCFVINKGYCMNWYSPTDKWRETLLLSWKWGDSSSFVLISLWKEREVGVVIKEGVLSLNRLTILSIFPVDKSVRGGHSRVTERTWTTREFLSFKRKGKIDDILFEESCPEREGKGPRCQSRPIHLILSCHSYPDSSQEVRSKWPLLLMW